MTKPGIEVDVVVELGFTNIEVSDVVATVVVGSTEVVVLLA